MEQPYDNITQNSNFKCVVLLREMIIHVELLSSGSLTFYMTDAINCFVFDPKEEFFISVFCYFQTEKQQLELIDSGQQTQSCTVTVLALNGCDKLI